jgi:wolfamin
VRDCFYLTFTPFYLLFFIHDFSYEYEIEVKISTTGSSGILNLNAKQETKIILKALHSFGNFTSGLNASDKIWFRGKLKTVLASEFDNIGCKNQDKNDKLTRIDVQSIGCLHCVDKNLTPIVTNRKLNVESSLKDLQRGIKYFLNALFNPLVTFK